MPENANGAAPAPDKERLNKFLARCGVASRRGADALIADGRVELNKQLVTTFGAIVAAGDEVRVDGERVKVPEKLRLWRYHKPAGQVTTHADPQGRPTVFEALAGQDPNLPRLVSVGRLDLNTEGLLLLTNLGGLAHHLEKPSSKWTRRYRVRAHGTASRGFVGQLKEGVMIDGVQYGAIQAQEDRRQGANVWYTVSLQEGKNREIRRVFEYFGLKINRLLRTAYGPFQLGNLPKGTFEEVSARVMKEQLGSLYETLAPKETGHP